VTRKILITGMSGLIGTAARTRLEPDARLTALNRSDVPGVTTVCANLSDFDAIRPAFEGQDTVVHLAAKASDHYSWEELRDTNVIGTRNVLEAARLAGCRRVVFASSGATVAGWEREEPYRAMVEGRYDEVPADWVRIRHDMATRPNGPYASTKVWGEALARHYSDSFDLSVIALRIGFVNAEDRPTSARIHSVWCSQRDIVNAIELAVDADDSIRYDIFFVNSDNRWNYRDLSHAREGLGFSPRDAAGSHHG
jgi:nucleoside-diphosphate-sugar epimerase